MNLEQANRLIEKASSAITETFPSKGQYRVGVDLGTAYIVLVVIDENDNPVAVELEFAQVLKDGLVVDYMGACDIVRRLKDKLEDRLGQPLLHAAIAIPPGTTENDTRTHQYVVESTGLQVCNIVDEPTAANAVIGMKDGVIVDIGGGTTGLSILKDGQVVFVVDEATGGTHVSLVLSGHYKVDFQEAETIKKDPKRQKDVTHIVRPVFEKMAEIVAQNIEGHKVDNICLVGGTCLLPDVEKIFEKRTNIKTCKPDQPLLATPLGIALNCFPQGGDE